MMTTSGGCSAPVPAADAARLAGQELAGGSRCPAHDPARHRAPARPRLSRRRAARPGGRLPAARGLAMPPLLLSDDEAVAIAVGLRTAAGAGVDGHRGDGAAGLVKLEQVLPGHAARPRQRAAADHPTLTYCGGPSMDPEALTTIAAACREHERLRFDYTTRDGTASRRQVEPHSLVHLGRRWYLVAFCCDRQDWRSFRVDRLERASPAGRRFEPREPAGRRPRRLRGREPVRHPAPLRGARHAARVRGRGPRPHAPPVGHAGADRRRLLRLPDG